MTRRYVLVKMMSDHAVTEEQLGSVLNAAVSKSFGDIGFARIAPKLIRFDPAKSEAVIACKREMVHELEAAVARVSTCGDFSVTPLVVRVSGTIKGLKQRKRKG